MLKCVYSKSTDKNYSLCSSHTLVFDNDTEGCAGHGVNHIHDLGLNGSLHKSANSFDFSWQSETTGPLIFNIQASGAQQTNVYLS